MKKIGLKLNCIFAMELDFQKFKIRERFPIRSCANQFNSSVSLRLFHSLMGLLKLFVLPNPALHPHKSLAKHGSFTLSMSLTSNKDRAIISN